MPQKLPYRLCSVLMMSQKFECDRCMIILTMRMSQTICFQAELLDLSVQLRVKISTYGAFTVSLSIKTF